MTGGLFVPFVATVVPIIAATIGIIMLGWADEMYAERELPAMTAWVFKHRWIVAFMLLPATLCGLIAAFVHRRYLIYGPYFVLLMGPLLVMVLAFAWLIVSIYAVEIESAM